MSTVLPRSAAGSAPWGRGLRQGVRRFAEAAVTPLELGDVLDVFHPLRSGAPLRGRIVSVRAETADAATLVIKPGRDWAGHVPGQYVRVGVDVDGVRMWRTYSLTHGPRPDGCISITVKGIPDGVVSNHLVRTVRPGQMVQLGQAEGDFVLSDPMPGKLLLVTAGSGITPVIGMLRNLFSRAEPVRADIVLLHSALSRSEVIFGEELRQYAAEGRLRLVELHTDVHGLLDMADLATIVPDLAERTTYACGPVGLLDALEAHHGERDLPLHIERFRTTVVDRRGRHAHLRPQRHGRRGRRGHPDPRRRRGRGRADAQRLPDGRLLRLRAAAARGRGPRPAQRPGDHRRPRRRREHPDLHQRRGRRLRHRPLTCLPEHRNGAP